MSMDDKSKDKDDTESNDDVVVEVALADIDGDGEPQTATPGCPTEVPDNTTNPDPATRSHPASC